MNSGNIGSSTAVMERRSSRIGLVKNRKSTGDGVSSSCYISDLPWFILFEIFSRIPIRAVLLCKCVCTSWYNLISEPCFSKCYSENSYLKPCLYFPERPPSKIELLEVSEISGKFAELPPSDDVFIGSCNGFLCLLVRKRKPRVEIVRVFNPIMGDCIELPGFESVPDLMKEGVGYHFGFNPSRTNFKVMRVLFSTRFDTIRHWKIEEWKVFTVGVDREWRSLSISSMMDLPSDRSRMLYFGGAFNWDPNYLLKNTKSPKLWISTFDLDKEQLGRISFPTGLELDCRDIELCVLDDQFCLFQLCGTRSDVMIETTTLWILRKYAVADSWAKLVTLKTWVPSNLIPNLELSAIAVLHDGQILFLSSPGQLLFSYNVKEKNWANIITRPHRDFNIIKYAPCFSYRAYKDGGKDVCPV